MIENEELFNERQFIQLGQIKQSELIIRHCSGIEERIRNARSKEEAILYMLHLNNTCKRKYRNIGCWDKKQ
jgi:adenine-specific DNA methylase